MTADDFIKKKLDDLIVDVGTNDIVNNANLMNDEKKLFRKVSKDSPSTHLAFSSIIVRKNKKNLEKSILQTDARLQKFCSQKGLGYIENSGIKELHLGIVRSLSIYIKKVTMLWQKTCYITLIEKNDQFFPLT